MTDPPLHLTRAAAKNKDAVSPDEDATANLVAVPAVTPTTTETTKSKKTTGTPKPYYIVYTLENGELISWISLFVIQL